jgi:hypothetical protein
MKCVKPMTGFLYSGVFFNFADFKYKPIKVLNSSSAHV